MEEVQPALWSAGVMLDEAFAWESTTPVYKRWITDSLYRRLRPGYRKWYRPICSQCGPTKLPTPTDQD